jgi:hypothetical protein
LTAPHPIHRRYLAENLVRLRRADEKRRYAASQRRGRIDPNPHQIDAVIFALRRIPEGGCILADEVGLGKTIEAGLVIAQVLAEGAQRILLIVPKTLVGQWRQELYELFGLEAREGSADPESFAGTGVFLVGREMAGSERGEQALHAAPPFDLCVIDEAHEIFAGIYRRFAADGFLVEDPYVAKMAGRVMGLVRDCPVMLLTATPLQNSLAELWGLVQYVEKTGTLLGDLGTFRAVFCDGDDRKLIDGQDQELRRRIATVCQRTLRRQAQDFLEQPFVDRRAQLFEYSMSAAEQSLYDDVTAYLLQPGIAAFRGNQRRLLLISFHRQMASSLRALAASVRKVAARLQAMLEGRDPDPLDVTEFLQDLEESELDVGVTDESQMPAKAAIEPELRRIEDFVQRAESCATDSKAEA